jgi:hypothetical protein
MKLCLLRVGRAAAFILAAAYLFFGSCARQVAPTGGLRDSAAPVALRMSPPNNTVNFAGRRAVVVFDEFITLKALSVNLTVSPPLENQPEVKLSGKKLIIDFSGCNLRDSTTYSIDFGESITDFTEGNILHGFRYILSTGPVIDSLRITGRILDAFTKEPVNKGVAMLHSDLTDSAPALKLPDYIAKPNSKGVFEFTNLRAGSFRLLALDDANSNLLYDLPSERVAFCDSILTPSATNSVWRDTTYSGSDIGYHVHADGSFHPDSVSVDSVVAYSKTVFLPGPIELLMFQPETRAQYIKGFERPRKEKAIFAFNQALFGDSVSVRFRDSIYSGAETISYLNNASDTLSLWLRDSLLLAVDTLSFLVTYTRFDSVNNPFSHTDTVMPRYNIRRDRFRGLQRFLVTFSIKENTSVLPGAAINFETSIPTVNYALDSIRLYSTTDTIGIKNRDGVFYDIDTSKIEIINILRLPGYKDYSPDSAYSSQRIVEHRYVPNRFMLRFGLPVNPDSVHISIVSAADNWGTCIFDSPTNSFMCWITEPNALRLAAPSLLVKYPGIGGMPQTQQIALAKGKPGKLRKTPRNSRLTAAASKQQLEAHYIDEMLELRFSNPVSSIDTALFSLSLPSDTSQTKLPAVFYMAEDKPNTILVSYSWAKNGAYVVNIPRGAATDIYGNQNREFLESIRTQRAEPHKILSSEQVYAAKIASDKFTARADWDTEKRYLLVVPKASMADIFGTENDSSSVAFSAARPNNLGSLEVRLENLGSPAVIELLTEDRKKIADTAATSGGNTVSFVNIRPGNYSLRLIEDANFNNKWDTGNYYKARQPERVRYAREIITIQQNRDHIMDWDIKESEPQAGQDVLPVSE